MTDRPRPIADFFGEITDSGAATANAALRRKLASDPEYAVGEWFTTSDAFRVATPDDQIKMILAFCVRHEELSRSKPPIDQGFVESMRRYGPITEFGRMMDDVKRYYLNSDAPRKRNYRRHLEYLFRRRMAAIQLAEARKNPPKPQQTSRRREVILYCPVCVKLMSFDASRIDDNLTYACPDCLKNGIRTKLERQ